MQGLALHHGTDREHLQPRLLGMLAAHRCRDAGFSVAVLEPEANMAYL